MGPGRGPHREQEAAVSRSSRWLGALSGSLIFFATGSNWQIGAVGFSSRSTFFLGASLVVNDSILPLISDEDDRDRVLLARLGCGAYLGAACSSR